jgi:AAHS family 4-hydroxybenzoate transporter-like MFS transporter
LDRSAPFDVQQFLDEQPMAALQWLLLGVCFLVLIADGFDTAAMAFVAPVVSSELAISKLALGPVLSAALIGLSVGSLTAGPLADRFGRRRVLIGSVLTFSVFSFVTPQAASVPSLALCRFLTGIGIGAAMPNCTTFLSEFTPRKRRAFLLNLSFVGFPLGASLGGFVAAALIPRFGWRSVFWAGGSFPILLAILLFTLPESVYFMVVRQWPATRIKAALNRIAGRDPSARARIAAATRFHVHEFTTKSANPIRLLLSARYRFSTLMLWTAYFMGLLLFYLLTSWMPILIRDAGHSVSDAARVTALFPLGGGLGALLCGWLMDRDRGNATRVVSYAYLSTAVLLLILSRSAGNMVQFMVFTLLAGVAMNGAQTSMPALAAATYPTLFRASGVASTLGIGRIGGVLGALAGGVLLQAGYSFAAIIAGLAFVAVLAALALYCMARASGHAPSPKTIP